MRVPLRVVLPVYNAQHSLTGGVAHLVEVLPEWAERFELVLVDDGSADDTADVARELAARFPQVRVVRHPIRLGLAEAIQTGLDHADARLILIGGDTYQLDPDDLRTLWRLRDTQQDMARAADTPLRGAEPGKSADIPYLKLPIARLDRQLPYQVVHRGTFDALRLDEALNTIARIDNGRRAAPSGAPQPNFLARVRRFALGE